jgi:hypothetical protein
MPTERVHTEPVEWQGPRDRCLQLRMTVEGLAFILEHLPVKDDFTKWLADVLEQEESHA